MQFFMNNLPYIATNKVYLKHNCKDGYSPVSGIQYFTFFPVIVPFLIDGYSFLGSSMWHWCHMMDRYCYRWLSFHPEFGSNIALYMRELDQAASLDFRGAIWERIEMGIWTPKEFYILKNVSVRQKKKFRNLTKLKWFIRFN